MGRILFIWNNGGTDGNLGSFRPSVYAAKTIGFNIDIAMNFKDTPLSRIKELEATYGVKLIHFDINRSPYSLKNKEALRQLVNIMKKTEYDIVHCNTPMGSIIGRLAAHKVNHRRVFYMNRGFAFYKGAPIKNWVLYYTIEKLFARLYTDAIATINEDDFSIAKEFKLRNNSNLKYSLPGPGVELSKFRYSSEARQRIRREYDLNDEDVVLISAGELIERKNNISIIEAVGRLKDKLSNVYYLLIGAGELQEKLSQRAKELGIADKVFFAGFRENVSDYYSASDIFALPSLSEGFGRVGIEAMNVGLPLITSNVQGINLYSIDGKTGFKCEARDVDGYAKAITILVKDKEIRNRIGSYNREFAKNFTMENSGVKIAEIYKDLMKIKTI